MNETKESLLAMVRLTTAQDDVLVQLQIFSDFSYAWQLVNNLTPLMQEQVSNIQLDSKIDGCGIKIQIVPLSGILLTFYPEKENFKSL